MAGAVDVRGEAATDAAVTITTATQGTPQSTTRTGKDFYRELNYTNTSAAVSDTATITGTRSGPPVQTGTEQRPLFLPQTPESFDYDDDGNLTEDGRWIYTWDAENRLIAMETKTSIVTAFPGLKQKLEFAYDAQGRRIRKAVQSWDAAANNGTGDWVTVTDLRFVYDGWNPLTELDALNANAVVRSYAWGLDLSGTLQGAGGVGGLLWANTTTHSFAASADGNGNIVAWVNTASLAFAGRADYGAFGEPVMRTGMAKALPFGFSSKYTDEETGLLYYGFRYYNSSTGRWPNRDPIGERGGRNLYVFNLNNALRYFDSLGAASEEEARLRELARQLRESAAVSASGTPNASALLLYYLNASGERYPLDPNWVMGLPETQTAIAKNLGKDRLLKDIEKAALGAPATGAETTAYFYWDAGSKAKLTNFDAYMSLKGFTVTTYAKVKLKRNGDCVTFNADIEHLVWDYYDFNAGSAIPMANFKDPVPANDLIALQRYGLAKNFFSYALLGQTGKGIYTINDTLWFDSFDYEFSAITPKKSSPVYNAVVNEHPEARRLDDPPPPRKGGGGW